MATTKIHSIGTDSTACLDYAQGNKTGEYKNDIADSINYVMNDKTGEVTYKTLSSYLLCTEGSIENDFKRCVDEGRGSRKRESTSRRKDGQEVVCWHLHQNFEGHEVDPVTANEIGKRLAEELFSGHPCVISTHTNTQNIHNHIVFCAWNEDGKKYNGCNENYRKIRNVSDRLCREYGLSVQEHTQDMKLHRYKDENGKVKYYEPTERKNKIINERNKGAAVGDATDYRNYSSYNIYAEQKENNRDMIKTDIDMLLPSVRSYDELLDRLRELGYKINDKKKNSDWLKHVSFTPPIGEKPTRDSHIGVTDEEKEFYRRENLSQYIFDKFMGVGQPEIKKETAENENDGLKYFADYDYAKININDINIESRLIISPEGGYEKIKRSPAEKDAIKIIRKIDVEIKDRIDTSRIDELIREQQKIKAAGRRYNPQSREEILLTQINNAFRSLRFMERNKIFSYQQITDLYKTLNSNYARNISEFDRLNRLIVHIKGALELPGKAVALADKINANRNNIAYRMENYSDDMSLLESYRATMKNFKIDTSEGAAALRVKVVEAEARAVEVDKKMASIKERLEEYENCISVLDSMGSEERAKQERAFELTEAQNKNEQSVKSAQERRTRTEHER